MLNGMGDANALAFDLLDHVVAAQRARPLPQPDPPAPLPDAYAARSAATTGRSSPRCSPSSGATGR